MANRYIKNKKTTNIIMVFLVVTIVVSVGVIIAMLLTKDNNTVVIAPDYAPQNLESNAEKLEDDDESKLEEPEGGGAVSITYSKEINVDLSDKNMTLLFENPSKSTQDMMIQIIIDDIVIAESGRIEPGYKVSELTLLDSVQLSEGTYEGKMLVLYYNQSTNEKAMINTEIPQEIVVKE